MPRRIEEWVWYVDDSTSKCIDEEHVDEVLNHINKIEEGTIEFTYEKEENGTLPVLDMEQVINKKDEKLDFKVHYKKTHTNINIKKKSNHPEYVKAAVIKGFAERARRICSEEYLNDELENIKNVFVANGYTRDEVSRYMEVKERRNKNDEEKIYKGCISIPYIKGFSEKYRRIMNKYEYRVTFKSGRKVKQVKENALKPIGMKQRGVVYEIPCLCGKAVYKGETFRKGEERMYEHKQKIRLTKDDKENKRDNEARKRVGTVDGRLAKHNVYECDKDIDWEKAGIICVETKTIQRKIREGVESLRSEYVGQVVLNTYDHLDDWQEILHKYFDKENK